MKRCIILLVFLLLFSGCAPVPEETLPPVTTPVETTEATVPTTAPPDPVEVLLSSMTMEEKIGQLFLIRCRNETAISDIQRIQPAGLVLFARDLEDQTPESLRTTLESYQDASPIPLLIAVDEEGGSVCRVSSYKAFRHSPFPSPRSLYDLGGQAMVRSIEWEKAWLLQSLGINVNLGPVCDIATQKDAFLYSRSLGQSPALTARFVRETIAVMAENNVGTVLKHFPGYGNNRDTHKGIAVDNRTLEELEQYDLVPFRTGIATGAGAIMMSHLKVSSLDAENPASLSPEVHRYLREKMGFPGVIVTDDLAMGAITKQYGAEEAAVLAVLAGNDLLCSTEFESQYQAVLAAVQEGRIPLTLLDKAVTRVLRWKQTLGLIE